MDRAIKDRYIVVDKKRNTITYLPQGKTRKLSNPEEKVQLQTFVDLIYDYKYPPHKIRVSELVKMGSATKEADVVVYRDDDAKDPYIVVECKKAKVSDRVFEGAIDQGFSYAAVSNAEYVWATSGDKNAYFEVWHDSIHEREKNQIDRIPKHREKGSIGFNLRRKIRSFMRNPVLSDTVMFAIILIVVTVLLSKVAVEYHYEIKKATAFFWDRADSKGDLRINWLYNIILAAATLLTLLFGWVFMRSHHLFSISSVRKRVSFIIIGLIIFLPAWYMGLDQERFADWVYKAQSWWDWMHIQNRLADSNWPIFVYLWPYIKALPFQLLAIMGLTWLLSRNKDKSRTE